MYVLFNSKLDLSLFLWEGIKTIPANVLDDSAKSPLQIPDKSLSWITVNLTWPQGSVGDEVLLPGRG